MSADSRGGTLPIRRWLALALATVFLVPVCVTVAFAVASVREAPHDDRADAIRYLRADADQWGDPAWQETAKADLARNNVAFILVEDDREIYRSTADPLVGDDGDNHTRVVQRSIISEPDPHQVAYVYANPETGPPDEVPVELLPFVALSALALTLTGIAWFLGRTVLKPLAATSQAARQVAAGDLDIELPSSRVREVAEVKTAFEAMSDGLRASLQHQSELEQERRLFIGAIVHDLRTPLFSLRGYLEGFEKGLADTPEKRSRYIAVAQEKAAELERLIADLFAYTRLEYLDQAPNREPLSLGVHLKRLVDGLQPQAEAKGVALTIAEGLDACVVDGDTHLLTRAVENLLDNALRYTPSGGTVQVECHAEEDRMVFSVADSGPGIAEHDLPHLFTPLYRGETSRNRRTGGAGLGLTIARRILLAHGGDLIAQNGPHGGAVFTGSLPAAEPRDPQSKSAEPESAISTNMS